MKLQTWLLTLLAATAGAAFAGDLTPPGPPSAGSGMPTTADIYDRLDAGAAIVPPSAFREPAAGPAPSGRSLAEVAARLPVPDNANGATPGEVAAGRTFWGLRTDGSWGPASGTAAEGTDIAGPDGALAIAIPDGLYAGARTATAADADLTAGNIRSGITVFGVTGTLDAASGNADAASVLAGRTFSNDSAAGLTGTMPDKGAVAITPGTAAQPIPAGYHNGAGSVAGDADLAPANIRGGTTVFGVTGTLSPASGDAGPTHVLVGRTFSNAGATGIAGAMPDHGAVAIMPGTAAQAIPAGYHNGAGSVAGDANLTAGNIKSGVGIFGVTGTLVTGVDVSHFATFSCSSRWAGPTCEACASNWTGPDCDTCAPNVGGAECDTCTGNYTGAACDTCIAGWSGANCEVHCPVNGWSGSSCDIIAMPFPDTPPSYASTPWKCVYDSATGLTWEVKTNDGGSHHQHYTYTWYDSASGIGTPSPGPYVGNQAGDTEIFVTAVNAEQWCGYSDWRLPTRAELAGLVNMGYQPKIDPGYFPNTPDYGLSTWSGELGAGGDPVRAWAINFSNGNAYALQTTNPYQSGLVRLVRGP